MSLTKIETITAGSGGIANFNFTSIPQVYSGLKIVYSVRSTHAPSYKYENMQLRINSASSTFADTMLVGNGSSAYAAADNSGLNYGVWTGVYAGDSATAGVFSNCELYIPNYTSSVAKAISVDAVTENNGSEGGMSMNALRWNGTAAITNITLTPALGTIMEGSSATLYGVNRIPTATLGATPTVDYLVVAGGGSGGTGSSGGGGGAGGMLTGTAFAVASGGALTVTVGAGGTAGGKGNNSVFSTITSTGGGGGIWSADRNGGSGGGGTGDNSSPAGGTGIAGQGNNGGTGFVYGISYYRDGGGGGAGGVGGDATTGSAIGSGGVGGIGLISTINGVSQYYAGGGGAAGWGRYGDIIGAGAGGLGGGGAGGSYNAGTPGGNGAPGTGGGGGSGNTNGAGGSGIVIIRYPDTYTAPTAVTGSPMVNHINGYRVYTWFNSGSITF